MDPWLEAFKTLLPILGPTGAVIALGWWNSESERRRLLQIILSGEDKRVPLWERTVKGLEGSVASSEKVETLIRESTSRREAENSRLERCMGEIGAKLDRLFERRPR